MIIMMNHQSMMFRALAHIREKRPIQVMRITSCGGDDYDEHDACMMYIVHASLFVTNIKSPTHNGRWDDLGTGADDNDDYDGGSGCCKFGC